MSFFPPPRNDRSYTVVYSTETDEYATFTERRWEDIPATARELIPERTTFGHIWDGGDYLGYVYFTGEITDLADRAIHRGLKPILAPRKRIR